MAIQPYLFFDGRCEEAVVFYRDALGAEVEMMMRYRDAPDTPPGAHADFGDKIIHASLKLGDTVLMLSDDCMAHPKFQGFALSIDVPDANAAATKFKALSDGGKVTMPLGETFFSPCFGMVEDRFGVSWMVIVSMPCPES